MLLVRQKCNTQAHLPICSDCQMFLFKIHAQTPNKISRECI